MEVDSISGTEDGTCVGSGTLNVVYSFVNFFFFELVG